MRGRVNAIRTFKGLVADLREMQKKRQEIDAKIKSILTDEQYKKYQDMRKKDNAKKKKKAK